MLADTAIDTDEFLDRAREHMLNRLCSPRTTRMRGSTREGDAHGRRDAERG
jgi:hypothetical protein